MGKDEPGTQEVQWNTFPLIFGPGGAEMEDPIGLLVVNGFMMAEFGSFKDTMKTVCSDL